jgi:broad specificity phosphatase PhoE
MHPGARPPGGESFADVAERVHLCLGMLSRERAGQRVLVVTHGGTLRVFGYLLERWTHDEFLARWYAELVPNCAVTTYAFDATPDSSSCESSQRGNGVGRREQSRTLLLTSQRKA